MELGTGKGDHLPLLDGIRFFSLSSGSLPSLSLSLSRLPDTEHVLMSLEIKEEEEERVKKLVHT